MDERIKWVIKVIIAGFIIAVVMNAIVFFVAWLGRRPDQSCTGTSGHMANCMGGSICPFLMFTYGIFSMGLFADFAIGVLLFLYSLRRRGKSRETFRFWGAAFIAGAVFSWLFWVALLPIVLSWEGIQVGPTSIFGGLWCA